MNTALKVFLFTVTLPVRLLFAGIIGSVAFIPVFMRETKAAVSLLKTAANMLTWPFAAPYPEEVN